MSEHIVCAVIGKETERSGGIRLQDPAWEEQEVSERKQKKERGREVAGEMNMKKKLK